MSNTANSKSDSDLVPRAPEPGSALWVHFGDVHAGLYGPHALLLQVMHPVIDAGVLQHSRFKTDPFGRLIETVRSMATLVYGGEDGAAAESRRLRNLHKVIRGVDKEGNRYHSLDPEAWAWVYATLVKGSIDSQNRFGRKLSPERTEAYYREARELGLVLGIRPKDLPETWNGFEEYFDRMIDTRLADTESARDVLKFLGNLPRPFFIPRFLWRIATWPIAWFIRLVTVGTLPDTVRERLRLTWNDTQEDLLMWFTAAMKIVSYVIPRFFWYSGVRALGYVNGRVVLRRERKALAAGAPPPPAESPSAPPP